MKWYKLLITGLVIIIAVIIYLFANISISEEYHVVTVDLTPKYDARSEVLVTTRPMVSIEVKNLVVAKITGYAPLDNKSGICADENPTVTSIGKYPSKKYAAVDPKKLPYGTKIKVPGYGTVEAGDTGGAMRNYDGIQIDLFFDTYEEAIEWGVKYIEVEIIQ